jgi:transcriptional regulator with XRE-family HTH domain
MTAATGAMPTDLHRDDRAARYQLRDQLVQLRRAQKLSQRQFGELIGYTRIAVSAYENRPPNPKVTTTQKITGGLAHRLVLEPAGLPAPDPDDTAPHVWAAKIDAADIDTTRWAAERGHIIAVLRAIREGAGVSQRTLSAVLDLRQSGIAHFETCPHGLWLSSLQRYARGIGLVLGSGGHLQLRLEPIP